MICLRSSGHVTCWLPRARSKSKLMVDDPAQRVCSLPLKPRLDEDARRAPFWRTCLVQQGLTPIVGPSTCARLLRFRFRGFLQSWIYPLQLTLVDDRHGAGR